MRNFKHSYALTMLVLGCLLAGCHDEVNLNNIDPKAEVDLGIALPVGSVNFQLKDFLGGDIPYLYIDSIKNIDVLTLKIDTTIDRNYSNVDLTSYISSTNLGLDVYKQADAMHLIGDNGKVKGYGVPVTLDFPLVLKLNGINNGGSLDSMRLDSALIEMASFSSVIDTSHLPLKWEWIDKVELDLGAQINRPAGNKMLVYDKTRDQSKNYDYGKNVPTNVDNFSIVLMKNRNARTLSEFLNNVIDTCTFHVYFTFTIPNGVEVPVPTDAKFNYQLGVQFIDYKAIWGWFTPTNQMHEEQEVDLGSAMTSLDFLTRVSLPFAEPKVDVDIKTELAGALYIDSAYLFVANKEKQRTYATFGESRDSLRTIFFKKGEWLPLESEIGATTTKMKVTFDNTPDGGHLDELFGNIPYSLGYRFSVKFNQSETPQLRITPNTAISVKATATLPLIFKEGLYADYSDTIRDINLSAYSLDSLISQVNVIKTVESSEAYLVLKAYNNIPLCVKGTFLCLDSIGQVIADPLDKTKPLNLFDRDTVELVAPQYSAVGGWHKDKPGETTITAVLTKEKMNLLPEVKNIKFTAIIDDSSLADAYSQGLHDVRILCTDNLKLFIGVSARADAVLDFSNNENQ